MPEIDLGVIRTDLDETFSRSGIKLLHVEVTGGGSGRTLKIFIDTPRGVSFDDCERASKIADQIVENSGVMDGPYHLEVSSPGIDRLLFSLEDAREHAGKKVMITLSAPIDGQKKFRGILLGTKGDSVRVETDSGTHEFSFSLIKRANLIADIKF